MTADRPPSLGKAKQNAGALRALLAAGDCCGLFMALVALVAVVAVVSPSSALEQCDCVCVLKS
jgi:hypothetical protein